MTVYILGLALVAACGFVSFDGRPALAKRITSIPILTVCTLAYFRAQVGTDTASYEGLAEEIAATGESDRVEPGFVLLIRIILIVTDDPVIAVRLLSVIFVALALVYLFVSDRMELLILSLYLAPVYFFQFSMNGLRIGIASILFYLSIQCLRRSRLRWMCVLLTIALAVHLSIALAIVVLIGFKLRPQGRRQGIAIVLLSAILAIFISLSLDYLGDQFVDYEHSARPSVVSGGSTMLRIGILVVAARTLPIGRSDWVRSSGILVAACLGSAAIGGYAGLRGIDVLAATLPVSLLSLCPVGSYSRRYASALALSGALGALSFLRSVWSESGTGRSPFAPYRARSPLV